MLIPVRTCLSGSHGLVLLLVLLLSTALGHTGEQATLAGQVVGDGGGPLGGVTVTLFWGEEPSIVRSTVTDADGEYRLAGLVPRRGYVVEARLEGYGSVEVSPLELAPGASNRQVITVSAQAPEAMIAGRWVRDDEYTEYAAFRKKIANTTSTENLGGLTFVAVKRLFADISELPVNEDVRTYLRYEIADHLAALPAKHPIIHELLATGDPTLQHAAIYILLNHADPWEEESTTTALLKEILIDPDSDTLVRSGILMLFASRENAFHEVEPWAMRWATEKPGGELARDAARTIAWNAGMYGSPDEVITLFRNSDGILRQELTVLAVEGSGIRIPDDMRQETLEELLQIVMDPTVPGMTKGEALTWLGFHDDPRAVSALIQMLAPDFWFMDWGEHSVPKLMRILYRVEHPALCPAVVQLRDNLHLLDEESRNQVDPFIISILRKCDTEAP